MKQKNVLSLDCILNHDPAYLNSVAGKSWEYCSDHKDEILALMENCALLHGGEIQRKIDHVINDRRKEIYCDIYLCAQ